MTTNKDAKREVRARMKKTGESYTAARAQVRRANPPKSTWPELAGMSDAAAKKKTGKDWAAWVKWLDSKNATSLTHPQIAKLIRKSFPDIGGWWTQGVTVAYERIRGFREIGQRRDDKTFDANKSKTFPVHVSRLYEAFSRKRQRAKWLAEELDVRAPNKDKSLRATWSDGTQVSFYFTDKGESKSSVAIQHSGHATKKKADAHKALWHERLQALARVLS